MKLNNLTLALGSTVLLITPYTYASEKPKEKPLETMVISASRSQQKLSEVPRSVTVIEKEQLNRVMDQSRNINEALALLVPGMGTSTQGSLTSKGQNNIRGRRVLLMIDGVSQNNSFLDFGMELSSIDPQNVERIEVIRGGSAVYGMGAQGGIINVITKTPEAGETQYRTKVGSNFQEHGKDSLSWNVYQEAQGGDDKDQWRIGLGYDQRGGSYDAEGKRLPSISNADDMDNINLNGVWNRNLDEERSLTLNFGVRNLKDNDGWCTNGGDRNTGELAEAVHCGAGFNNGVAGEVGENGPAKANPARRTFSNVQVRYQDIGFKLGMLDVTGFYMNQNTESYTLRMKSREPGPTNGKTYYGHNKTNFDRYGVKLNISSMLNWADVTWGMDVEQQSFSQPNSVGLTNNTPDVDQFTIAPFSQFASQVGDNTTLSYGVRMEHVRFSVNDYKVGSTHKNAGKHVKGGNPTINEFLFNLGATHYLTDNHQVFASFAQGMATNEVLRTIRTGDVDNVNGAMQPVKTDNYELGFRGLVGAVDYSLAGFYSTSKLGATLSYDSVNNRLESTRAPEHVWGVEATLGFDITSQFRNDTTISFQEGERKLAGDTQWQPLDGSRIAPVKVTSSFLYDSEGYGRYNLNMIYSGQRDKSDQITQGARNPVDSFFLMNLGAYYDLPVGTINIAVENLLNEKYMTAYKQSLTSRYSYYRAPGRRIYIGYEVKY